MALAILGCTNAPGVALAILGIVVGIVTAPEGTVFRVILVEFPEEARWLEWLLKRVYQWLN